MEFHLLPTRTAGAAENMALDFLLLQRYPRAAALRFRHYEWRGPAFTFGFSQKIAWVRAQLAPAGTVDLCRRPTGGGLVDHRHDWTYALVIPREHPWWEERAARSYRALHECIAQALRELGQPAVVKPGAAPEPPAGAAGICFEQAEPFDVVHERTGRKIAGAAQKRNKHGLLCQGSIWKPAVDELDWDQFGGRFLAALGEAAGATLALEPWPEFNEEEVAGLVEQYASLEWLEHR
ncbi:MAG TPA: lipoate--protein ligase family protein [Opitutaceae bacterium]|nr:lipoate--protein ligase family protein [Opitutaceae bacterium]